MKLLDVIKQYKTGRDFTNQEIEEIVMSYSNEVLDDKTMTLFLKGIYNRPLSVEQTAHLTNVMMNSGDTIDLSEIEGIKVDKHSTGGVGDKVTIIVGPIVAALGAPFAKMSGRGLGFTGGTLDKLESIPKYNISFSEERFIENIKKHGIAVIGQTSNIVPADKRIYALRDETNLIDSMPLIASSIMSKKLATGSDAILLDVKCGNAAFMKTQKDAEELARWMIELGKHMDKDVRAEITSMETPLGKSIGNKNEIIEAIDFLKGKEPAADLKEVIYSSASTMLVQAGIFKKEEDAIPAIEKVIASGKAFEKFKEWIKSQDGLVDEVLKDSFWAPEFSFEILAKKDGFLEIASAVKFGTIAMKLGAGREKKEDDIDYEAGIQLHFKSGAKVKAGEILFELFSSKPIEQELINEIEKAYKITNSKKTKKVILNKL